VSYAELYWSTVTMFECRGRCSSGQTRTLYVEERPDFNVLDVLPPAFVQNSSLYFGTATAKQRVSVK
jgi:hypothetical protein